LTKVPLVIPRTKAFPLVAAGSHHITNFDAASAWQAARRSDATPRITCDSAGSTARSAGPYARTRSTDCDRARQNRESPRRMLFAVWRELSLYRRELPRPHRARNGWCPLGKDPLIGRPELCRGLLAPDGLSQPQVRVRGRWGPIPAPARTRQLPPDRAAGAKGQRARWS